MPEVGDSFVLTNSINTGGYDFSETGEDYVWDYIDLQPINQVVDTFVSVQSTPLLYQIFFLYPFVSTIASPSADLDWIPGFEIMDVYEYFKDTDDQFHQAGFALTLAGIPLPIKYDDPDIFYIFPVEYGNVDSSFSSFSLGIPELGFYSTEKKRKNIIDGWGSLTTPFGNFETLRIKSEIQQFDSLYIDTLGIGFPINREYIEYKWMGQGSGIPLLTVREEGAVVTIQYQDSLRIITSSPQVLNILYDVTLYPNPCSDFVNIVIGVDDPSNLDVRILSVTSQSIGINRSFQLEQGKQQITIDLNDYNLPSGSYIVILKTNKGNCSKPLIIR